MRTRQETHEINTVPTTVMGSNCKNVHFEIPEGFKLAN
jgi:hypothetical protein